MKIEKNKLVNRAQVLNKDIQLGIIAYSVAEMASIAQSLEKRNASKITEEEDKAAFKDCKEYIRSAKEFCDENGLDWSVCILLSRSSLKQYTDVESKKTKNYEKD